MHEKYLQLFKEICKSVTSLTEILQKNNKSVNEATSVAEQFNKLINKLENNQPLTKADYAVLYIGTTMVMNVLNDRAKAINSAITSYQNEIIPRLQKVLEANEDNFNDVINSEFQLKEE